MLIFSSLINIKFIFEHFSQAISGNFKVVKIGVWKNINISVVNLKQKFRLIGKMPLKRLFMVIYTGIQSQLRKYRQSLNINIYLLFNFVNKRTKNFVFFPVKMQRCKLNQMVCMHIVAYLMLTMRTSILKMWACLSLVYPEITKHSSYW